MIRKIPVKLAASLMGKKDGFVRIGIQRGLLPFGVAIPAESAKPTKLTYYISPKKFMDYTGITKEEIEQVAKEKGYTL